MIEIVKGVPLPTNKGGRPRKYPLDQLEVGDMLKVSADQVGNVRLAALHFGKVVGRKFASRKIDSETYGIWRIA